MNADVDHLCQRSGEKTASALISRVRQLIRRKRVQWWVIFTGCG